MPGATGQEKLPMPHGKGPRADFGGAPRGHAIADRRCGLPCSMAALFLIGNRRRRGRAILRVALTLAA